MNLITEIKFIRFKLQSKNIVCANENMIIKQNFYTDVFSLILLPLPWELKLCH